MPLSLGSSSKGLGAGLWEVPDSRPNGDKRERKKKKKTHLSRLGSSGKGLGVGLWEVSDSSPNGDKKRKKEKGKKKKT